MSIEIERKFLVTSNAWRDAAKEGTTFCQGYLSRAPEASVRVRIEGDDSFLTIKGPLKGITRAEFQYPIPFEDAEKLLLLCVTPLVIKTRYKVHYKKQLWEVDEFHGENDGLFLAEIELPTPETAIHLPPWVGKEVSAEMRYYNSNLATHPFTKWEKDKESSKE
ncbi:MAG: CYTH domain-containing protein [Chthoniobacterales bacterium]|nr:CYTH domain-containing protein [Chthoniobacterales bacterium]